MATLWHWSTFVSALLLAACGGGVIALLPYVVPVGGFWIAGTQGDDAWLGDPNETLATGQSDPLYTEDLVREGVTFTSRKITACGDASQGMRVDMRFDDRDFTLSPEGDAARRDCLRGRVLEDDLTLELQTASGPVRYRNNSPPFPNLNTGVWQDHDDPEREIAFRADLDTVDGDRQQTGCLYQAGTRVGSVLIRFTDADPDKGVGMRITTLELQQAGKGTQTLQGGRLVGRSAIEAGTDSQLQLVRRDKTLACPFD